MGTYVNPSDIDDYIGTPLADFSIPKQQRVEDIIASLEARLDAAFLSQDINVPLTDPRDLALISQPLTNGVACEAYSIFIPDHEPPGLLWWCNSWNSFIMRAEAGKIKLPSTGPGNEGTNRGIIAIELVRV
jgi:hypothetical protein